MTPARIFLFLLFFCSTAFAENDGTYSIDDLLTRNTTGTPCATRIYESALAATGSGIENPDEADTTEINTWAHLTFNQPRIIESVLKCPEIQSLADTDIIVFDQVQYTFPTGRTIKINYETHKGMLKQKLIAANKPKISPDIANPDILRDIENGIVWTNVDPSWYGILVAEHGTLDEFIKPDKTNVLSLKYIEQNIKKFYPRDHNTWPQKANCTSKTASAEDTDMINRATARTVGAETPKYEPKTDAEKEQSKIAKNNDYYVMGDGNLQWISGAEIAADIVLTVVTWGGFSAVKGTLTATRGIKSFAKAQKAMRALRTSKNVAKWTKTTDKITDIDKAIKAADKIEDSYHTIANLNKTNIQTVKKLNSELDALKSGKANNRAIRAATQELEIATKQANASKAATDTAEKILKTEQTLQDAKNTNKTQQEIQRLEQEIAELKKTYAKNLDDLKQTHINELNALEKTTDVKEYQELSQARRDIAHTTYLMRQGKVAFQSNRGLLPVRAWRSAKTLRAGSKSMKNMEKAIKTVRANTTGLNAHINDWLFHSTLKNITALSKVVAGLTTLQMVIKIAGDMYDYTDLSTGKFTNNIDMKPFLLLGADNLPDYENEVNHGMWLFWAGSSTNPADDDAAFLQTMSFAEKFHQDLVEVQDEYDNAACDVDIFVVRPIIRAPGTPDEELYYLFMNNVPWTTHDINNINPEIVEKTPDTENQTDSMK